MKSGLIPDYSGFIVIGHSCHTPCRISWFFVIFSDCLVYWRDEEKLEMCANNTIVGSLGQNEKYNRTDRIFFLILGLDRSIKPCFFSFLLRLLLSFFRHREKLWFSKEVVWSWVSENVKKNIFIDHKVREIMVVSVRKSVCLFPL